MSALDELVRLYRESGHPFPKEAAAFATGGLEVIARALLDELDAPRQAGTWQGVDDRRVSCRALDRLSDRATIPGRSGLVRPESRPCGGFVVPGE